MTDRDILKSGDKIKRHFINGIGHYCLMKMLFQFHRPLKFYFRLLFCAWDINRNSLKCHFLGALVNATRSRLQLPYQSTSENQSTKSRIVIF